MDMESSPAGATSSHPTGCPSSEKFLSPERLSPTRLALTIALLLILGSLCYANSLKNSLLQWDDQHYILDNPYIRAISWPNIKALLTKPYFKNYSPLHVLSYQIDYHFWKFRPEGYRLVNILLHLASTILVFLLIFDWYKTYSAALSAAAIFAVHTIHVESVVWISQRKDVLSALFFFLSLYGYSRFRNCQPRPLAKWSWYAASLLAAGLALLSKPVAITLPLILILCEVCFRRPKEPIHFWSKVPFFLFSALVAAATYWAQRAEVMHYVGDSFWLSLLLTVKILGLYLGKLFLPIGLSNRYLFSASKVSELITPSWLLATGFFLLFLAGVVFLWFWNKSLAFPGCWFLITLLPVANLVPTSTQMADRYLYLPSVGYCLAIGLVVSALIRRGRQQSAGLSQGRIIQTVVILLVAGLVVLYGALTLARNRVWRDDRTLWEDALAKDPANYWAATYLANTYLLEAQKNQDLKGREENINRAKGLFLQAIRQEPNFAQALLGMGSALLDEGNTQQAIAYLWQARRWSTEQQQALRIEHNLGVAYAKLNQFEAAEKIFTSIIKQDQTFYPAYLSLGKLYLSCGTLAGYQMAAEQYSRAIASSPYDPRGYLFLGIVKELLGDYQTALINYHQALQLAAGEGGSPFIGLAADIHLSLAGLYHRLGDYPKAIDHYTRFLELAPRHPKADLVRSIVLELRGKPF